MIRFWDGRTDRRTDGQTDGVTALLDLLCMLKNQPVIRRVQFRMGAISRLNSMHS